MGDQNDTEFDVSVLQGALNALPEGERTGNKGRIFVYVLELFQSGWSLRQAARNIGELSTLGQHLERIEGILNKLADDGKEAILEALDYQKRNCTDALNNEYYNQYGCTLDEIYDSISVAEDRCNRHDETKQKILDTIKSYHQEESNKAITNMAKTSTVVVAFQAVKIYLAWKQISEATNVVKDPNKFTQINRNIAKMEEMVTELLDLCERDPTDRGLDRKMTLFNSLFTSTLGKISDLKIDINGHIQRLDLVADHAAIDGAVNLVTAASQAYQLWHTWESLTSFTKTIGMASTIAFGVLAAGNATTFFLSREKLDELRKDLNEAVRLQGMLEDLHDQASQAFEDLRE